ncbi:hypothetical protein [Streptomyces orinoci]|uniref:Uncharacterized protein n=1 Tax=Streptomyces orinoci TaxID=67339 RepID=A0ABV3JWJ4_STRON|nr:hypothetical protein [Streptomyces orinoci]
MRTAKAQAVALAARFAAATGQEPRTEEGTDRIRVEVDLPSALSDPARRIVLAGLAAADRYGHDFTGHGAVVWAEPDLRRAT